MKIGDKVEIVNCFFKESNGKGKEGIIKAIDGGICIVEIENFKQLIVNEDILKLITPKTFTKDDLRDGDIVELKNGEKFIVYGDNLFSKNCFSLNLNHYGNDFRHFRENDYEFKQVIRDDKVVYKREEGIPYQKLVGFQNKLIEMINDLDNSNDGNQALEGLVKVGQTIMDFIDKHYELEDEEEIRAEVSL